MWFAKLEMEYNVDQEGRDVHVQVDDKGDDAAPVDDSGGTAAIKAEGGSAVPIPVPVDRTEDVAKEVEDQEEYYEVTKQEEYYEVVEWKLARVVCVYPDRFGIVRNVEFFVKSAQVGSSIYEPSGGQLIRRHVSNLLLLCSSRRGSRC